MEWTRFTAQVRQESLAFALVWSGTSICSAGKRWSRSSPVWRISASPISMTTFYHGSAPDCSPGLCVLVFTLFSKNSKTFYNAPQHRWTVEATSPPSDACISFQDSRLFYANNEWEHGKTGEHHWAAQGRGSGHTRAYWQLYSGYYLW